MLTLTTTHEWRNLGRKANRNSRGNDPTRPSSIAKKVDGASNCVVHSRLMELLEHYRFPPTIVRTVCDFNQRRSIYLTFDGEADEPVSVGASVPHGSPLPPIFFVMYTGALTASHLPSRQEPTTDYVDDEITPKGAITQPFATRELQQRINRQISRGPTLNIKFFPSKSELMHIIPHTSKGCINQDTVGTRIYEILVRPNDAIQCLGVWVDRCLSFKT